MALIRISSGSATEPVSLDEMKAHLRVDYDAENDLIEQYISAAREKLERRCARCFTEQTWELREAEFEDSIEIPKPPTVEIAQVAYLDEDHAEQTVDPALYALVEGGEAAFASLIWIGDKPTALASRPDAARIRFVAGWAADEFPSDLKQAILFMAAHLYENRQSVALTPVRQEIQEVPSTVEAYIAPYIVPRL